MKIAVTSTAPSIDAIMDERFGRCAYFVIVDTETMEHEGLENHTASLSSGSGIQAARTMADRGVSAVLTGNVGPKAYTALEAAGLKVITGCIGTVRDSVEKFKTDSLASAAGPNVSGHAGSGPRFTEEDKRGPGFGMTRDKS